MVGIAAGVGVVWARRDGAGVAVAAVVPPSVSVWTALVSADSAVLFSTASAVAIVLAPSSALLAPPFGVSVCAAARRLPEAA